MKPLDWAKTFGNFVTIDICPSIYLVSEVLNPQSCLHLATQRFSMQSLKKKFAQELVIRVGTSSITLQLLHLAQMLRWFLVPKFLHGEELLESALLRSRGTPDLLRLEGVVWVDLRWGEEEVPNLSHEFTT